MYDGALEKVRSWNGDNRDALLDAVKGLVALVGGASGVKGHSTKQIEGRGAYITGPALLQSLGLKGASRYLASAAVFAVAAAIRSHLDPGNCNEDAVRRSLTALCLSGDMVSVLPSVAD